MRRTKIVSAVLVASLVVGTFPITALQPEAQQRKVEEKQDTSMTAETYLELLEDAGIPVLDASASLELTSSITCPVDADAEKYDPRESERMTSVKDQGKYGLCWDFATQACAEQYLINAGKAMTDIDFSESYFAYYLWKNYIAEEVPSWSVYLKDAGYNTEYYRMHINDHDYLPIAVESNFPYENLADMTSLSDEDMENYDYKINKCYYVDYSIDEVDTVKSMIVNYGAVVGSYHDPAKGILSDYYNNVAYNSQEDYNCYAPTTEDCNHAITIVGWDDNYAATNFKTKPAGDGAWLCKNSWGTGRYYGNGYFWLSYYNQDNYGDTYAAISVVDKTTNTGKVDKSYVLKYGKDIDLLADYPDADLDGIMGVDAILDRTDNGFTSKGYGDVSFPIYNSQRFKLGYVTIKLVGDPETFTIDTEDVEKYYPANNLRMDCAEVKAQCDGKTVYPVLTSSDESVVQILYDRYYQIQDFGTATITASYCNEYKTNGVTVTKTFEVRVLPMCESLQLAKQGTTMEVGAEESIVATTTPAGRKLRYISENPAVVTVDENGKLNAIQAGTTYVTVETTDGSDLSKRYSVVVKEQASSATSTQATTQSQNSEVSTQERSSEKTTQVSTQERSSEKTTQVSTQERSSEKTTQVSTQDRSSEKTTQVSTQDRSSEKTTQVSTQDRSSDKSTEVASEQDSSEKSTEVASEQDSSEKSTEVASEQDSSEKSTEVTSEQDSSEKSTEVTSEQDNSEETTEATTEKVGGSLVNQDEQIHLVVKESRVRLTMGERHAITLLMVPEDIKLVYRSTNTDIATVDQNGVITAGFTGDAFIEIGYMVKDTFQLLDRVGVSVRYAQPGSTERTDSSTTEKRNETTSTNETQNDEKNNNNTVDDNDNRNTELATVTQSQPRYIQKVEANNLYFTIDTKMKKATVTGVVNAKKKSYTVPDTVLYKGTQYTVNGIETSAFSKCTKATKITIGKNITSISSKAFAKCKKLTSIIINSSKLTAQNVNKAAFKGVSSKATMKVPKKKLKAYKKWLKQKGFAGKVKGK